MGDKKLKIGDLKVKSFVTILDKQQQMTAKGGYIPLSVSRRKGRWTQLDTRGAFDNHWEVLDDKKLSDKNGG